jgi:hypothetical protein
MAKTAGTKSFSRTPFARTSQRCAGGWTLALSRAPLARRSEDGLFPPSSVFWDKRPTTPWLPCLTFSRSNLKVAILNGQSSMSRLHCKLLI